MNFSEFEFRANVVARFNDGRLNFVYIEKTGAVCSGLSVSKKSTRFKSKSVFDSFRLISRAYVRTNANASSPCKERIFRRMSGKSAILRQRGLPSDNSSYFVQFIVFRQPEAGAFAPVLQYLI